MHKFFLISAFFISLSTSGQYLDLAKVEYTIVPGNDSNFALNSVRMLFNVPFKIKDDAYFFAGVDYTQSEFQFQENVDTYDKSDADEFHEVDLNLTYTFTTKKKWRLGIQLTPSFSSNLQGALQKNDFLLSGVLALVKDKKQSEEVKKPWRIILGLAYSSTSRSPFPFPFFSYYRKFHPRWSYNIGAPVTNIQFHLNEKNRLKFYAEGDGFNAHIQEGVLVNDNQFANRLRMLLVMTGLRYEYKFSKHIESYINITRTVLSDVQLRRDTENVFIPNIDNVMLYRVGIRCKI